MKETKQVLEYEYVNALEEIIRLNEIIDKLKKKLIDICNTCYEDKETARIEKWIREIEGDCE